MRLFALPLMLFPVCHIELNNYPSGRQEIYRHQHSGEIIGWTFQRNRAADPQPGEIYKTKHGYARILAVWHTRTPNDPEADDRQLREWQTKIGILNPRPELK